MENSNVRTYKKSLLYFIVTVIVLAILGPAVLKIYLATPQAASHISRMLSDTLGQPVVVNNVFFSDGALHLKGVSLDNPAGFSRPKLLSIDSITIKPVWFKLLSDDRIIERIAVEGINLDLRCNNAGVWNVNQMLRRLSSLEPSSTEYFINKITITKGTLQINDQKIAVLTLNISNLATKGTNTSGFRMEFDDTGRNHYVMSGKARLSKDPELEIVLSSSAVSLNSLSGLLKVDSMYLPEKGNAKLQLTATLSKGNVRSSGEMRFSSAVMPAVEKNDAFSGNLALSADYDMQTGQLTLENLSLDLDKLLVVRASGSVKSLKQARYFVIDIGTDEIDIGKIGPLIPALERRSFAVGGTLGKSSLHLSGNSVDGISAASGNLRFSHGLLIQDKRHIFNDLSVTAAVSGIGDSLTVTGKVMQTQSEGGAMLETLDAPYKVTLNRHFKIITAQSPALTARAQGVSFTGRLSYEEGTALLENATVTANDLSVTLGHLSARIPVKQVSSATVRFPVTADFTGCDMRRGDALLKKVSGNIRGAYFYKPGAKWLEGAAELYAQKMIWQGKESGATRFHAEFLESGGTADVKTALLGGSVQGTAVFNPFALQDKVVFKINAQGIQLTGINKYAGLPGDMTFSGGTLAAVCNGNYSLSKGFFCHIAANGENIELTGKTGKKVLSAGGIKIDSDVSDRKLVINEAMLTTGKKVAVKASGAIENAFLQERQGVVAFNVPRTSLTDVVDSFLNILPRSLQEATVEGILAAEGSVILLEGSVLADGAVTLADITIDAPTENIRVSGISGVLPLSLYLAGRADVTPPSTSSFNRQNYDTLVKQLHQTSENSETINIRRGSLGGLRVDSVKIRIRADRGVTEIVSLDSSIYEGALLGKGFITVQNGLLYRGDLLFNNLSLVKICKAFPAITGYLSGKIDGIVSIQGKGTHVSDITGFTEFWARETAGEKMLVSKEFLQRLSGKKLSGFFFSSDRSYDHAGIKATLDKGFLSFDTLDLSHTNILGVRDLSVSIAPSQNRIAIDHLLKSVKEATVRGTGTAGATGGEATSGAPPTTEFKWAE
ncbi:MAG: AsmA family protein [Desulfuromonadaceae bacterium]|nr:AsmA family protein [Desulfuromonadaceae bacterium]